MRSDDGATINLWQRSAVSGRFNFKIKSMHSQLISPPAANLTHVSLGASIGWLLITSTGLQHRKIDGVSHLDVDPLDDIELVWVVASVILSGLVGTIFVSWMADGVGRKHTLCTLSLVQMVGSEIRKF